MHRLLLPLALLATHPLHTTHTDVVDSGGHVTIQVRAFTDDLNAAVRHAEQTADDSGLARYLRRSVVLFDTAGRQVGLVWAGRVVEGDITLVRMQAPTLRGLAGIRVGQTMHMELFSDQVNVVQATYGGHRTSLLFVPGDPPRRLP